MMVDNTYDAGHEIGYRVGQFLGTGFFNLMSLKITLESIVVILLLIGVCLVFSYDRWKHKIPRTGNSNINSTWVKLSDDPATDKKWKERVVLVVIIIFAILVWILVTPSNVTNTQLQPSTLSPAEIQKRALEIPYDYIARYPEKYTGKIIRIEGKVIQVQQSGDNYTLRVYKNGDSSDDVIINAKISGARVLENDEIIYFCRYEGLKTYTTVLGASRTVPELTKLL